MFACDYLKIRALWVISWKKKLIRDFFFSISGQLDLTGLPYASPARPSTVQKEIDLLQQKEESKTESQPGAGGSKKLAGNSKSKDNSQWFSLFADLDPLANPDAIGKTTKESDPNCYSWIKFLFLISNYKSLAQFSS